MPLAPFFSKKSFISFVKYLFNKKPIQTHKKIVAHVFGGGTRATFVNVSSTFSSSLSLSLSSPYKTEKSNQNPDSQFKLKPRKAFFGD